MNFRDSIEKTIEKQVDKERRSTASRGVAFSELTMRRMAIREIRAGLADDVEEKRQRFAADTVDVSAAADLAIAAADLALFMAWEREQEP